MVKNKRTGREYLWIFIIAGVLLAVALLMTAAGLLYPPIPMFLAAITAGIFFRGRPPEAARAGALAGLAGGVPAEAFYFNLRAHLAGSAWSGIGFWEKAGLGLAELLLYAALLSFFAAFVSWSAETPKAPPEIKASESPDENDWQPGAGPTRTLPQEFFAPTEPAPSAPLREGSPERRKKA